MHCLPSCARTRLGKAGTGETRQRRRLTTLRPDEISKELATYVSYLPFSFSTLKTRTYMIVRVGSWPCTSACSLPSPSLCWIAQGRQHRMPPPRSMRRFSCRMKHRTRNATKLAARTSAAASRAVLSSTSPKYASVFLYLVLLTWTISPRWLYRQGPSLDSG